MIRKSIDKPPKIYSALDGLRTYSAFGIVLMHVFVNGGYKINGFIFEELIPSFTNLVFLFMVISGFSMCCGYYEKIQNNTISMKDFYAKRFAKVWPFFALLCLIDVIISPSLNSLYELFANLTLCFGLLPNADISVIGVAWFLGVVFVFYLIFPFFSVLISSKRNAWFSFFVSVILNYLCTEYFFDVNHVIEQYSFRTNIVYCFCFFLLGGLIYLYRNNLEQFSIKYKNLLFFVICIFSFLYFMSNGYILVLLSICAIILIYALGRNNISLLTNIFTRNISNISLEIYLSHMVLYRVIEKLRLTHLFASELVSYLFTSVLTIVGTLLFVIIVRYTLKKLRGLFSGYKFLG